MQCLCRCISISPCLPFHHTSSPSPSPLPRALFIVRLSTASRLSASECAPENSAELRPVSPLSLLSFGSCTDHISSQNQWVLGRRRRRCCRRTSAQAINRFQYGPAGDCEWNSILFCKIVHLLDEQILMAVLAGCFSSIHTHTGRIWFNSKGCNSTVDGSVFL